MAVLLFNYTLFMLLASVMASATCLSAYLVSRMRSMLFLFFAFLFYFLDIAWVFQDSYLIGVTDGAVGVAYYLFRMVGTVISGAGFIGSLWLLACDYLDERRRRLMFAPIVAFAVCSFAVLIAMPESYTQSFLFYAMRAAFAVWILGFSAYCYISCKDQVNKGRLRRHLPLWFIVAALLVFMEAEDYLCFFIADDHLRLLLSVFGMPDRNYAENMLMLCCAVAACRSALRVLSMRFEKPPVSDDERHEAAIRENLLVYANRYKLPEREQQVLTSVLQGKDNQNIASELSLALSTVKVHIHNILRKTDQPNRQALIQDFWKTS